MRVCYPEQWGPARFERVGELLLIPPGKPVVARCDFPQGTEHYTHSSTVIRLNPDLVYQWSEPGDWDDVRLEAGLDIDDPSIYSLMGRLTREAMAAPEASSPASSQRLIDLIAEQLGIEINRYFRGRQDLEFKGGLATWRLRRIDERTHNWARHRASPSWPSSAIYPRGSCSVVSASAGAVQSVATLNGAASKTQSACCSREHLFIV